MPLSVWAGGGLQVTSGNPPISALTNSEYSMALLESDVPAQDTKW